MELFILLLVFILGFCVGEFAVLFRLHKVVVSIVEHEMGDTSDEDEQKELHKLFIENINDILYLYYHNDKTFICQAKTIEELAKISQEYKNIKYAAVTHDGKLFAFVDGSVKNI